MGLSSAVERNSGSALWAESLGEAPDDVDKLKKVEDNANFKLVS